MAGSRRERSRGKGADAKGRVRRGKPKVCVFCAEHIDWVDYKDVTLLRRFMSDRGKIKSRANTGTCTQHQADVAVAIKNAREMALLPYVVRTLSGDKSAGRRGRGAGRGSDRPQGDGAAARTESAAAPAEAAAATGAPSSASGADGNERVTVATGGAAEPSAEA